MDHNRPWILQGYCYHLLQIYNFPVISTNLIICSGWNQWNTKGLFYMLFNTIISRKSNKLPVTLGPSYHSRSCCCHSPLCQPLLSMLYFAPPLLSIIAAALSHFPFRQVNGQKYFCPSPLLPGIAANAGKSSLTQSSWRCCCWYCDPSLATPGASQYFCKQTS